VTSCEIALLWRGAAAGKAVSKAAAVAVAQAEAASAAREAGAARDTVEATAAAALAGRNAVADRAVRPDKDQSITESQESPERAVTAGTEAKVAMAAAVLAEAVLVAAVEAATMEAAVAAEATVAKLGARQAVVAAVDRPTSNRAPRSSALGAAGKTQSVTGSSSLVGNAKTLTLQRLALGICAFSALAACGGSQPPIGAPGAMPQTSATATRADRGKSWMLPGASSEDLMYVSDAGTASVYVFSYPGGKSVGTLNGLGGDPDEVCSDNVGNVFVTEYQTTIQEYAHGGTTPIATLKAPGEPEECSVDPTSGNLAVGIYTYETYNPTGVAIYTDGQGSPTLYTDSNFAEMIACSYDDNGNLFVAGRSVEDDFALAELPAGSSAFVDITLKRKVDGSVRDIQWTGSKLAIGDYINPKQYLIYRVAISGTTAKIVGNTQRNLEESQYFSGDTAFFIRDDRVAIDVQPRVMPRIAGEVA
jgi:hypothetical protein